MFSSKISRILLYITIGGNLILSAISVDIKIKLLIVAPQIAPRVQFSQFNLIKPSIFI